MNRLIDQGDYVTDTKTGLDWQKATTMANWHTASTLQMPEGWRLPTKYELFGLHEAHEGQPRMLDTFRGIFWSSSEFVAYSAWVVNFNEGSVYDNNRNNSYAVRLVRASQSLGIGHVVPIAPTQSLQPLTFRQQLAISITSTILSGSYGAEDHTKKVATLVWKITDAVIAAEDVS